MCYEIQIYLKQTLCLEPVKLIGEGEYNMEVLKEILVTDSYLGMNKDIINCQNKEPFFNCTTRKYMDEYIKSCGCVPSNIRLTEEVL